jgi:curved DNA-binding protein CbpA
MTDGAASHDQPFGQAVPSVDLYEVLEISPRASPDVIQAAYRSLARTYHPDLNPSTEAAERIRQVNAAYRVLNDPQNRACYDLDRARARRADRLRGPDAPSQRTRPRPGYSGPPTRRPQRAARPVEVRAPLLTGQFVVGILAVVVLTAILFVVIWTTFDPGAEYNPAYVDPYLETIRH